MRCWCGHRSLGNRRTWRGWRRSRRRTRVDRTRGFAWGGTTAPRSPWEGGGSSTELRRCFFRITLTCRALIRSKASVRFTVSVATRNSAPWETTTSSVVLSIILQLGLLFPTESPCKTLSPSVTYFNGQGKIECLIVLIVVDSASVRCRTTLMTWWFSARSVLSGKFLTLVV